MLLQLSPLTLTGNGFVDKKEVNYTTATLP
jgi:hypothetical protein